ncbi:MAG TPA: FAD-dependent oxidoreductase [Woeseiaceae bacterium]|nr:FAD-dependent oxidoreductase [Woeseiaceae bacterium]
MTAIWNLAGLESRRYAAMGKDLEVEVAIVGGGVTGLSAAIRLLEAGRKVAVLEALQVGQGSSGNSTGNLYGTLSQGLRSVRRKWGDDALRQVGTTRSAAVDAIESRIRHYGIECRFERRPLYFCLPSRDEKQQQDLADEYEASLIAGLRAELVDHAPGMPVPVKLALLVENQAQLNPLRYAQELAKVVASQGGLVFEDTPVIDVDASEGRVSTANGVVTAKHIVFATHTPKGINLVQAEMEPSREYGVAAPLKASPGPEGIFWLLDQFHSVRTYRHEDRTYLVVIGEKHPTGQDESGDAHYDNLRQYARQHFNLEEFSHGWSAQQYKSADQLPYIGRSAHDNVYVGTGYGADGLTWGEVAATIITDLVMDRETEASRLFNPRRFTPVKSAKSWAALNAKVAKHLTTDYLTLDKIEDFEQVRPSEGKVVSAHGDKVAVYRSPDNVLSVLSAVCPHMKCMVKWNPADTSWDCPCHGSRFKPEDGSVIEGPAYGPLTRLELRDS